MAVEIINSKSETKLIEKLWIIEKKSGICIFERDFDNLNNLSFSNDLVCGFFSAICMFASEIFAEDINYINLSNRKLCFKYSNHFLFVILIKNSSNFNIRSILDEISDIFLYLFNQKYKEWDRDIHQFDVFSIYLENKIKNLYSH